MTNYIINTKKDWNLFFLHMLTRSFQINYDFRLCDYQVFDFLTIDFLQKIPVKFYEKLRFLIRLTKLVPVIICD